MCLCDIRVLFCNQRLLLKNAYYIKKNGGITVSLGFIYGKAGTDRQKLVLQQLEEWQSSASVSEIFYIVPDHIKFESEVTVLDYLRHQKGEMEKMFASANVQTFSFSRLMWYFLKEQPALTKTRLTPTGLSMIVTHILHELDEKELYVFTRERNSPGFSKKLAEQIVELKLGGFLPEDLEQFAKNLQTKDKGEQVDLGQRLHDLSLVYTKFEKYIAGQYLDTAESLDELINYLQTVDLSQSCFVIDGFTSFNAKEKEVISVLMQKAAEVRVSLILNHKYVDSKPETSDLFYQTGKIYYELTQQAKASHVARMVDKRAADSRVSADLTSLEDFWIDSQTFSPPKKYYLEDAQSLSLTETSDRVREIRYVAAKIRNLVFTGNYKYHDFLILTPQQDKYQNLLENVMDEYDIPIFTDLNKTMLNHPLVEFVLALFSVQQQNYSYRSVMRLLKTEIFVPKIDEPNWTLGTFRNTLDLLENCILQNGYFYESSWKDPGDWVVETCGMKPNESPEEHQKRQANLPNNRFVNKVRREVYRQLSSFFKKINKVKTGREFAVELINFLEKIGVPQTLQGWQVSAAKDLENDPTRLSGSVSNVSRHEEVWNTLCSLLDEYVTALGAEPLDLEEFIALIQNGFDNAKYSQVPSTLDQVIFSESGVVQMQNRRVLFFVGVTDAVMPRTFENNALLSDIDRDEIEQLTGEGSDEKYLTETAEIRMAEEPFANYLSFMAVNSRIFFTYPLSDNDGQPLRLSPYIERIKNAFSLQVQHPEKQLDPTADNIIDLIGTKATTLGELLSVSRDAFHNGKDLHATWRGLYRYLSATYNQRTTQLFKSLGFSNDVLPGQSEKADGHKYLDPEIVHGLYGDQINTSISKLETFFADPYQYFLQYGLKLRPRQEFLLQPADTGEYFHFIMEYFFRNILKQGKTLAEISSNEFDELMAKTLQQVSEEFCGKIFSSTARYRYTQRQLTHTADQVIHAIARQRKKRKIYTVKTETSFGDQTGLPALVFADPTSKDNASKMNLRGRIDRIDLVEGQDGKLYYNVIDYKSGDPERKMDHFLLRAFNGLSLQLLTYLRALQQAADNGDLTNMLNGSSNLARQLVHNKKDPELGSASYLHLFDPIIKKESKDHARELDKNYMYKGIFRRGADASNEENGFLLALDQDLESAAQTGGSASSDNYPVKYVKSKKDFKTSTAKSLLLTINQIRELLLYNDLKIEEARKNIFAGVIDLAPYRLDNSTGLDYSDYQEIMMFDPLLDRNNYRKITKMSDEEIWSEIQKMIKERGATD